MTSLDDQILTLGSPAQILFDLRSRYRESEPFSEDRDRIWTAILKAETQVTPDIARDIIKRVIFPPKIEVKVEQLELAIAA